MNDRLIKLYSKIVLMLSEFSSDTKLKVGALLLKDERIVATGYNGQPTKINIEKVFINNNDKTTIHAEMNCLSFAAKYGISVNNCILFVSHFPCVDCIKLLYQAGIKQIYYINEYKNNENFYKNIIKITKVKNGKQTK